MILAYQIPNVRRISRISNIMPIKKDIQFTVLFCIYNCLINLLLVSL